MSLKDLINNTRNRWATLRVESLTIDSDLQVNGNIASQVLVINNLVVANDAAIGNNLTVTNDAQIGADLDVVGELDVGGELGVVGEAEFTGNVVVAADPVAGTLGDIAIEGTILNSGPDEDKRFLINGPIYEYTFPFDPASAAVSDMTVRIKELGGVVTWEMSYLSGGISVNVDELRWNPPLGLPERFLPANNASFNTIIVDENPNPDEYFISVGTIVSAAEGGAANEGNIVIEKFAVNDLINWPAGTYRTNERVSTSFFGK